MLQGRAYHGCSIYLRHIFFEWFDLVYTTILFYTYIFFFPYHLVFYGTFFPSSSIFLFFLWWRLSFFKRFFPQASFRSFEFSKPNADYCKWCNFNIVFVFFQAHSTFNCFAGHISYRLEKDCSFQKKVSNRFKI